MTGTEKCLRAFIWNLHLLQGKRAVSRNSICISCFQAFQAAGDHLCGYEWSGQKLPSFQSDREIRRLFPEMVPREKREEEWPVWTAEDGLKKLMAGLREAGDKNLEQLKEAQGTFLELFRRFYGQEEYRKLVEKLTDAAFFVYEDKGIGRAAARALYGQKLQGSVTRLEQFAACAYAHFLKYGLELMERQEYQLEAVDMGNLVPPVLRPVF